MRYVIWGMLLQRSEQSRCCSREETAQGQHANPGGPLYSASFGATIVFGRMYERQQFNLTQYKGLPRKSDVLLFSRLTICLGVLVQISYSQSWIISGPPNRDVCDNALIFLTGTVGGLWMCCVRSLPHRGEWQIKKEILTIKKNRFKDKEGQRQPKQK